MINYNDYSKHILWQKRIVNLQEIEGKEIERQTPACEICHCLGNLECGHENLDTENLCTLQPDMICPCCRISFEIIDQSGEKA